MARNKEVGQTEAASISHALGATMAHSGLLCLGSQQPLLLWTSTALVDTAEPLSFYYWGPHNGPQQTAPQRTLAYFTTEETSSHHRTPADFAIKVFTPQVSAFTDASHLSPPPPSASLDRARVM